MEGGNSSENRTFQISKAAPSILYDNTRSRWTQANVFPLLAGPGGALNFKTGVEIILVQGEADNDGQKCTSKL